MAHTLFYEVPPSTGVVSRPAARLPEHPVCPHCQGTDTELMNPFGSILANAQFYCHDCRSPFEFVKWEDRDGPRD